MEFDELERFRKLYPQLSENKLREARDNLNRYIELAVQIYDRIRENPAEYQRFRKLLEERKERAAGE